VRHVARSLDVRTAALAACLVLIASCKLGPDFVPPAPAAPAAWKSSTAASDELLPQRWWTLFGDAQLDQLVERALVHNQELMSALARVEQARAAAGLARSALSPGVSINPTLERERFSDNRAAPPGARSSTYTATNIELPLDVAYEVDLWGRLRRAREAAEAAAQASGYDYDALALAISGEVARTYFALRSARGEEDVLQAGTDLRRRALDINDSRSRAGVGNDLDTSRARTELARTEAELHGVTRARFALENALAVLCGAAPSELVPGTSAAELAPPTVPAGLPSELLRRRPDVAAAIERLHEASARIGQTKAEAFPRLSLTASAGFVSTELAQLFDSSSRAWLLGADVQAPLFQGGAFDQRNRAAKAFYDERAADYRSTLLIAFREVEDALSALTELQSELRFQTEARTAAQQTFDLADARYRQGLVGYLDVVDAARSELDSRRAIVQLERLRAESTVLLIQALGGGWSAAVQGTH
jgi:outer membrane protein, multidrug efflux system